MIAHAKKQILVVDDEKNLANMLALLLQTRGYEVIVAGSAHEAMQRVTPEYDLILLDLVLPDFNGFEVCRRIKRAKETQHIPIIMLSARAVVEDRLQAFYLGADDFLSKPVHHEELMARMEVAMRRQSGAALAPYSQREKVICELRKILDGALLVHFFQPIYQLTPFHLYGVEMLTRPATNSRLTNPEHFFKAALQYGLYTELEMMSWSMAFKEVAKNLQGEKLFLNCDPYFIESSQFLRVKALFTQNHIAPQDVVLEITERSAISDYALFCRHLARYRADGFQFAVDDAGGGYASLETIVEARPEIVKIDRKMITHLCDDPVKQSVVKSIVWLCKQNAIFTIAEGVETREELQLVQDLGIDAVQGFFLHRPAPAFNRREFSSVNMPV